MFDDVVRDVRARVESVVLAKMSELGPCLSSFLSGHATEARVRDESDALKVLLAGVETRFGEEQASLAEAINAQKAMTKVQTSLLEALYSDVTTLNERVDVLCSHTGRLGHIERDAAAIAGTVLAVEKADTVTSFVSGLYEHLGDIRLVVEHKADEIRKVEQSMRLVFHWEGT